MRFFAAVFLCSIGLSVVDTQAATHIRIMPPDRGVLASGQRFDLRVEATSDDANPPRGLTVLVNGVDVSARNILDPGVGGERGAGGTGATASTIPAMHRAVTAPPNTTNFLLRDFS